MTFALAFLIVFVLGPWTFVRLTKPAPSPRAMRALLGIVLAALLLALGLRFALTSQWSESVWLPVAIAAALWVAWIGVIALVVQALRRADSRPAMRRWSSAIGAISTTVPWFGIVLADLLRSP